MRTTPFAALKSLFANSDEQAMWRVQHQDDAIAFAQLVRRWEKPIQNLCVRMTGDPHDAEDLAQDVFARVFAKRAEYKPSAKFSTWIWRIALNRCYDELRRRRLRSECSLENDSGDDDFALVEVLAAPDPAPDRAAANNEHAELVRQALLQLPEAYRSTVILRHYEDLKFREIADVLDVPEGTVKSRMAEAMSQLARLLQPALGNKSARGQQPASQPKQIQSSML
ncbi:MAG: sigma-70 family RNA polymerase sigma factor [Verrucomicrobiales bacterium]|nr:sigma-70 family RNA polymerase sigma factor [Verrucomicrobiales bacterium]